MARSLRNTTSTPGLLLKNVMFEIGSAVEVFKFEHFLMSAVICLILPDGFMF